MKSESILWLICFVLAILTAVTIGNNFLIKRNVEILDRMADIQELIAINQGIIAGELEKCDYSIGLTEIRPDMNGNISNQLSRTLSGSS